MKSVSLKHNNTIITVLKGAFNALIVSLVGILIFAFIIKFTSISDGLIKPINQAIKVISVLFGCIIAFKSGTDKTIFKGILIGFLYTLLAFILFSSLNGKFVLSVSLIIDLAFGGLLGLLSAVATNIFKKN